MYARTDHQRRPRGPGFPCPCRGIRHAGQGRRRRNRRHADGAARPPRRQVLHRLGQGGRGRGHGPGPAGRHRAVRPAPVAGPAAQPGTAVQPARGRPGRVDPGYLRAARQEPRRQAAGRAGPAAASGHAPDAHVEPPGASARRHWHARSRRIAAGNGPPHDRRQGQGAARAPGQGRAPARHAAPRPSPAARCRCRWWAIPTPASPRCSMH